MTNVLIVDYGFCNLDSVSRAVQECGGKPHVSSDPNDVHSADKIILPGVGSFFEAMKRIRKAGWDQALTDEVIGVGIPMLGICLGMQLLASEGTEGGKSKGLGFIPGRVSHLASSSSNERIPHIGWNEVCQSIASPIFDGIDDGKDFYFVHSYHFQTDVEDHTLATTPYCGGFTSVVGNNHIVGTQFHPEKSLRIGFRLLRNFLNAATC